MNRITESSMVSAVDPQGSAVRRSILMSLSPVFLFFICLLFSTDSADARVRGRCKDCHAMHNSREGSVVTRAGLSGPFSSMTIGGCMGCHGQNPNGTQNIIVQGNMRIPQVIHYFEDGDLAGGNYIYVAEGHNPVYSRGHNVEGISLQENSPMNVPPGFVGGVNIPGGTGPLSWSSQRQLTCAGTWGCHGNRTIEDPFAAMSRAHHEDDGEIDGSTVGRSYRFLYGILGKEHRNWEYLASVGDHNGYKGDYTHSSMNTISYLCGECHAKFHPNANLGGVDEVGHAYDSVWRRHPSDISFGGVHNGYLDSEYGNYVQYSLESPVAYQNPTGRESKVDMDSIIMCLSCHRAHASPYPDMLRWDYSQVSARDNKSGKGCLVCHTKKSQ